MSDARKISKKRLMLLLTYVVVSIIVGYFWGEPLRLSEKPSEYIGLLFSILAASIFAVVSIIGDPSMLLPGTRRLAWESALAIQSQIQRLNVIFFLQILTLALLIVTELVESMQWGNFYWVFNILAGLATFCFLLSLSLPFELGAIQRDRLKREIEVRNNG